MRAWNTSQRFVWKDVFQGLQNGALMAGAALVLLALFTLAFPTFVAMIVATFILFVGALALILGYKVYKFRKDPEVLRPYNSNSDYWVEPDVEWRQIVWTRRGPGHSPGRQRF